MARSLRHSLVGASLVAASLAATALAAGGGTMTATASSLRIGATNVRLTLQLSYEMQCNYPGPGPVVVTLPGPVPAKVAASAVLVNGKAARGVSAHGRQVTVELQPRPQILCDLIGPGRLTIELTPRAGITNPATPGSYRVTARKGTMTFAAKLMIATP